MARTFGGGPGRHQTDVRQLLVAVEALAVGVEAETGAGRRRSAPALRRGTACRHQGPRTPALPAIPWRCAALGGGGMIAVRLATTPILYGYARTVRPWRLNGLCGIRTLVQQGESLNNPEQPWPRSRHEVRPDEQDDTPRLKADRASPCDATTPIVRHRISAFASHLGLRRCWRKDCGSLLRLRPSGASSLSAPYQPSESRAEIHKRNIRMLRWTSYALCPSKQGLAPSALKWLRLGLPSARQAG